MTNKYLISLLISLILQACGFGISIPLDEAEPAPAQPVVVVDPPVKVEPPVVEPPLVAEDVKLGKPSMHDLTQVSNSQLSVRWNPGEGSLPDSYDIYRCEGWACYLPDKDFKKIGTVPGTRVDFDDDISFVPRDTVGYIVQAQKGAVKSEFSDMIWITKKDIPIVAEPF